MADQVPDWFHNALADGLTTLIALALPGTPPAETVTLTLNVWVNGLWTRKGWIEAEDAQRLEAAFVQLAGTCDRWPAPRQLLQALPPRPEPPLALEHHLSPEQMAANKQRAQELLRGALAHLIAPKPKAKE